MLLIALATLATMSRLRRADFTNWDDNHTISENPALAPPTLHSLRQIWAKPFGHLYVPVTYSIWWMLAKFSYSTIDVDRIAQNPAIFHAANLLLHVGSALVVFALLRRLCRDDLAATAGALLFALHPVQVESVGWCSGLKDVLAGLLSATALLQYVIFAQAAGSDPPRQLPRDLRRTAARHYLLALAAFCLAILAKPIAMVVPLMALAIELCLLKRKAAAIARGIVPLFAIAIIGAIEARRFQIAIGLTTLVSMPQRVPVALDAIAFYLCKLIAPTVLTFDYGRNPRAVIETGVWKLTWFVPIFAALLIFFARRRVPALAAGAIIFLAGMLPVLGFGRFDFQEYSTVADHYLYLPMIGVALALAGILQVIRSRAGIVVSRTAVAVALILLAYRSFDQTQYWMNSQSLMRHAIAVNPKSWVAWTNLGEALSSADKPDEALQAERTALTIRPVNPDAHMNIGSILLERGQLPEATREFETALREQRSPQAHVDLANAYGQARRFDDAIAQYKLALELSPEDKIAARMLAKTQAYLRSRKTAPASNRSEIPNQLPGQNLPGQNAPGQNPVRSGNS